MLLLVAGARLALLAGRALSLAPALLLLLLLALLADRSPRRDLWLAAALLGSLLLLRVLLLDVSERVARRETLRTRAELATRVVDKALALRPQAVKEDADVLQMATTDARNVADATEAVHQVWTASVQIVLAAGMIGYLLGPVPAVTAMAAVALLAIPIASFISARALDITSKAKDFANIRADMERELLQSIRLVKLCAWENPLLMRIEQVRAQELHSMRQSIVWAVLARVLGAAPTVSTVAALLSFTAFAFTQDASLTPDRAFPVIAVLLIIQEPMRALPGNVNILNRAKTSRAKIEAFLELPELISKMESRPLPSPLPSSPLIPHPDDPPFELRSAVFRWVAQNDSKPASFTRLSVAIPRGKLTVILGAPKSGKSTLVSALIGELCPESGFVNLPQPGTVSFAPETPFLMTTESIRDNILFGAHHDQARLDAVLEACELKPRVAGRLLTQVSKLGDERKILDRALSQRVAFARAVYATSRKELFAMDDSLSELDPGSASRVYHRCLVDSDAILAGTTRVLALSADPHDYVLEVAQRADWIVVMDRQKVVQMGSFNDLVTLQPNGKLAHLVSLLSDKCTLDQISEAVESGCDSRAAVARSAVSGDMSQFPAPNPHIQDRMAHEGTASWSGSALYLSFCGWLMISSAIVLLVFSQLSKVSMDLWLVHWTDESASSQPAAPLQELDLYIYIYLGMSTFVLTGIGDGIIQYGGLRASKAIHSRLLNTVAKASTRFFASQPLEGVARCFSSEMSSIDYELVGSATKTTTNILALASMLMVELFFGPQLLVPLLIPVFAAYVPLRWRYTPRRNILDCYDSKMLYSVNSRLNETISGAATVRAFGMASSISQRFSDCFSEYTYSATQKATLESWLNLRLRLLDATSLLIITFAVVLQPTEDISQAVFALQLLYALSIGVVLNDLATNPGDASRAFSSVQYVSCLWDAETEPISLAVASTEAGRLRSAVLGLRPQWPEQGQINLINVSVNSEHLQSPKSSLGPRPAILGVSLAINAGECVGVCSTGASVDAQRSLLAALFRLTPCSGGVIEIDGVPITQLDLLDLRSRIAVIPSEPLVFVNESLRFNLDPSARSSDDQLWEAMRAAGLDPTPLTLDSHVGSAVATNFGSRLWLARVLVGRPPRVIVVDASGSDGDAMVSAVRSCEPLQTSTVLILAHDAATIADCDRILLLGIDGRVVELGAPAQLLASPSSAFSALLDAADDWAPEV